MVLTQAVEEIGITYLKLHTLRLRSFTPEAGRSGIALWEIFNAEGCNAVSVLFSAGGWCDDR